MSAPREMPVITSDMTQSDVARALGGASVYVFPTDHPGLNLCAGIGKGHDPFSPNHVRGKHPCVTWDEKATIKESVILAHWAGYQRNIGIHCGRSGFLVVDEDAPDEFARFATDHGVQIPETFTVTTAKGKHYYFADTEAGALGNREGAFEDYAINIRSGNGYVIGPGSLHETGVIYTANGVRTIAALPAWIPAAIRQQGKPSNGTPTAKDVLNSDPFSGDRFTLPDVIKVNSRHSTLMRFASSLLARDCPLHEANNS